jgi:uridine monophosphate synthetase
MKKPFFTLLEERVRKTGSLLCIGIDPHPQDVKGEDVQNLLQFCLDLVEATVESAAAYKPNAAFFEAYGPDGIRVLQQVIASVPEDIPVILDAKRGDISSTAQAYAHAVFKTMGAGAVTINPYLGKDAVDPFIADPDQAIFLLCKTSNPGSGDLQDLTVLEEGSSRAGSGSGQFRAGLRLYERVALLAQEWNINKNIGLVVGATHPKQLGRVRGLAPDLWFLAPGIGTQGGDLEATLLAGLREDGSGVLVNVSRSITRAPDPGQAARDLLEEIQQVRARVLASRQKSVLPALPAALAELAEGLLEAGCVKFGSFKLKSGLESPIYIDLRQLVSHPVLLAQASSAYIPLLKELHFDRIAALPYAALPIAAAISIQSGWPMIYPRKEIKAYGTKAEIEGSYTAGEKVVVIDDLATTGGSKFEAIEKLTGAGLEVHDVVVLIDRQSGAFESLAEAGLRMWAVFTLSDLLDYWERQGHVALEHIQQTREFLQGEFQ